MTVSASAASAPSPAPGLPTDTLRWLLGDVCESVLAARGDAFAVQDAATGRYLHASAEMLRWLGLPADRVIGRTSAEIFDPSLAALLRAAEQSALAQGELLASEHRFDWHGVKWNFGVLRMASRPDAAGRRWLASVWTDRSAELARQGQLDSAREQIEQQQRAHESLRRELAEQGLRDAASGLSTRAHFDDQLRREVDLSTREHREFALVFVEIDTPADEVRAFGAAAAQAILAAMGRLLRGGTRAMDASCRFDERRFAVLLSGVGLATAHSRMEGLRRRCATEIVMHDGHQLGFTAAMGVASFPHTAQTQDQLLAACEAALAEARRRGGNHVTLAAIRFEDGAPSD
ncbi:MAG: diguanylate cyclase [Burkholderiales bacterium]|nr:diguanylate cyclase [Burkholderiales bacterium]